MTELTRAESELIDRVIWRLEALVDELPGPGQSPPAVSGASPARARRASYCPRCTVRPCWSCRAALAQADLQRYEAARAALDQARSDA